MIFLKLISYLNFSYRKQQFKYKMQDYSIALYKVNIRLKIDEYKRFKF